MGSRGHGPPANPHSSNQRKRSSARARPGAAANRLAFAVKVYITEGHSYGEATAAIMSKFGVSRTTAQNDLRRAGEAAVAGELEEARLVRARVSAALWQSRRAAHAAGDHAAAVGAMRALIGMHGLSKATIDVNPAPASVGSGIGLGTLGFKTPEEVKARIAELRARLQIDGPPAFSPSPDAG